MKARTSLRVVGIVALASAMSSCGSGGGGVSDRLANRVSPGVLTGSIDLVVESDGTFIWGDSINELCQQWSVARNDRSGWFYGRGVSWSSVDVFVLEAPADPLAVIAAENFNYSSDSVEANEGDTVFFRGRNGFFGAWTIGDIDGGQGATLSGTWYFVAGGGGDFTLPIVAGGESVYQTQTDVCS